METFLCDFCVHRFPLFCQKNVFKSIFISKKRKKDSFPHTWSIYSSFPSGHFARLQKGSQLTLWGYCPMTTCPAHRHNTGHLVSSIIPMHLFKQMRSFTSLCRIRLKKNCINKTLPSYWHFNTRKDSLWRSVSRKLNLHPYETLPFANVQQTRSRVAGQDFLKQASQQLPYCDIFTLTWREEAPAIKRHRLIHQHS